jgi:hypothetical protein
LDIALTMECWVGENQNPALTGANWCLFDRALPALGALEPDPVFCDPGACALRRFRVTKIRSLNSRTQRGARDDTWRSKNEDLVNWLLKARPAPTCSLSMPVLLLTCAATTEDS